MLLSDFPPGFLMGLAAVLGLLFGMLLPDTTDNVPTSLLALPLGVLRALYVLLPYVLCTVACSILGRSVVAGAVGGFLFLLADAGLGALSFLAGLGGPISFLLNLIVQPNINTLIVLNSQSFGLDPAALIRAVAAR